MKYIIILSIFFLSFSQDADWCKGFRSGYQDGWCYQDPYCFEPIPPLCPLPTIYDEYNYRGGYNKGFLQGVRDREDE